MTPPARKTAAKVASRLRSRNRLNGTTGLTAVRSTNTNAAGNAVAGSARAQRHHRQPTAGPARSRTPPRCSLLRSATHRGVELHPLAARSRQGPAGQVDHEADRHVHQEDRQPPGQTVRAPPTTRPITEPTPVIAAKIAGRGVVGRPLGTWRPAPDPARRWPHRHPAAAAAHHQCRLVPGATPHRMEAMVKRATPTMKVRLRPMVSPRRPRAASAHRKVST